MSSEKVAESALQQMSTTSINLTPKGIPLNFHISTGQIRPKVGRPPRTPPAPRALSLSVVAELPPLIDEPAMIDLTKKYCCRLTVELNRVPIYLYIDRRGIEYIGIEKAKGLREAFSDDQRRQFELDINETHNLIGEPIKLRRIDIPGLEGYKSHNYLLRVSDLEYIMRNKFSRLTDKEMTAILDDFNYSMQAAIQLGDRAASPEPNETEKPTKRTYRKKRDRDETAHPVNGLLMETILRLEGKVDQLTQIQSAMQKDNDELKVGIKKTYQDRLESSVMRFYMTTNEWTNRKIELEARVTFDSQKRAIDDFTINEVPKLKAAVAEAELDRIKKLLQQ